MDEKSISGNIKEIRKLKKMTLQDLADRTGLTKGYLSKVERSDKAPPYTTLSKIAAALDLEVPALLKKDVEPVRDSRISFSRKEEGRIIRESTLFAGYDYEVLASGKPGKNMEPFIIYAPFAITKMYEHEGEEFIYVMDGEMEFVYGDDTYHMKAGDHVYFDSMVPHSGRSLGDKKARLMVVIYFYKRNRH